MDNVVMGGMRRQNNITDILRVDGNINIQRAFRRTNGGDRVSCRTNAANTLHNHPRIARIAVLHDLFHTAPHGAGRPCFGYDAVLNFAVNA
ncbi:hypothetical protein NGUA15_00071 [Salmonella enterica]|nr:hypothetical protein NGUA15_00071 [Salmonella enterica]CGW35759.1 Uncharacterised protein [Salmonella enterica subsp. enterica serovar Typhi]CQQ97261.1 Uncharacterised protein [Salmonella enterica subsp. enterica serovar Typhimurium str. DT104]